MVDSGVSGWKEPSQGRLSGIHCAFGHFIELLAIWGPHPQMCFFFAFWKAKLGDSQGRERWAIIQRHRVREDIWESDVSKILPSRPLLWPCCVTNIWAGSVRQVGWQFFSPLPKDFTFLSQVSYHWFFWIPNFHWYYPLTCHDPSEIMTFLKNPFSVVSVGFGKEQN